MFRFVLSLVPAWGWLLLGSIGATAAVVYHLQALHHVRLQVRAEIETQAAEQYRIRNQANAKVTDAFHQDKRKSDAAAVRLRTDLERVRDELRAQQATATDGGPDESATAVRELLGECVGLYDQSARDAASLAAQVRGLQNWAEMLLK